MNSGNDEKWEQTLLEVETFSNEQRQWWEVRADTIRSGDIQQWTAGNDEKWEQTLLEVETFSNEQQQWEVRADTIRSGDIQQWTAAMMRSESRHY